MNIDDLHELDDPDGFRPDPEFRAGVRARGRRLKQRRTGILGLASVATVLIVLVGGFAGYQKWRSSQVVRLDLGANLDARVEAAPEAGEDPPPAPSEAVNILVVGSDASMPGEGREVVTDVRTDTMMVVRADPDAGTIGVLSLPRDLWVEIPGHGMERLNTAWETGGPGLLIDTIKANLEIPVNHFLQVDGNGFQRLVDQAGGSDVWVAGELRDMSTGFATAEAGCVHLDGAQALALVRSRHLELNDGGRWVQDPASDLGRIERQQVMGRVLASSLLDQDLGVTAADDLLDTLIDNAAIDDTWAIRDMAGLLFWAQDLDLGADLTMATPPVTGGWAGSAAVLFLDEAAAPAVLAPFRPPAGPATGGPYLEDEPEVTGADGTVAGPTGTATSLPTTTTSVAPAELTADAANWVRATAPDGTRCP
jgi:LCP family protein required for cell wall assembly